MRHRGCLTLLLCAACTAGRADTPAKPSIPGSPFVLTVHCPRNPQCVQSNKELQLIITVTNRSDRDAYLTVDYMRATGPYSTITDTGTEDALYGHTSLASDELLSRYHRLGPSESATVSYMLGDDQLRVNRRASKCAPLRIDVDFHARWGWEQNRSYRLDDKGVLVIPGSSRPGCAPTSDTAPVPVPKPVAKYWINVRAKPKNGNFSDLVADMGEQWGINSVQQTNRVVDVNHTDAGIMFTRPRGSAKSAADIMTDTIRRLTK